MENTLQIRQTIPKRRAGSTLLPLLVFMLMAITGSFNRASAQKANLSDWNVPPPLPPGSVTKGNTTGKSAPKSVALSISDIPAVAQPAAPGVPAPALPAISQTSPPVTAPAQPEISDAGAGLAEIPSPAAPDAPSLPQNSPQDAPVPAIVDVPEPTAPDMPATPAEPVPSVQTGGSPPVPLMPNVVSLPPPSAPPGGSSFTWSTPAIPENISLKFAAPAK